jgi:hypothetical protein
VELDDGVSGFLVVAKPLTKYRELSRTKRSFVVSAIKRFVQFHRIDWLLRFFSGETILKIDHKVLSFKGYSCSKSIWKAFKPATLEKRQTAKV